MIKSKEKTRNGGHTYTYNIIERTCPECNRNFVPAVYHAYRINDMLFCKYTCMLHYREKKKKNKIYKKRGI